MKKLIIPVLVLASLLASATFVGCKSITVTRNPDKVATNPVTGEILLDEEGHVVLIGGWSVSYFQHWNWQRLDSMKARAGNEAELEINGYASGADSNLVKLVSVSMDGVSRIADKVVAAILTYGGSVAVNGGSDAIVTLANKFIAAGGDESKATVTCKDGSCTVTDGRVTCTEDGCIDCKPTSN